MPLPEEPRARFRKQAKTRVPAAVTALQRVAKMASPDVPECDRQHVFELLEYEFSRCARALESGRYNDGLVVFDDDDEVEDTPDTAEVEAPGLTETGNDATPFA
jgi:hypothetical protein